MPRLDQQMEADIANIGVASNYKQGLLRFEPWTVLATGIVGGAYLLGGPDRAAQLSGPSRPAIPAWHRDRNPACPGSSIMNWDQILVWGIWPVGSAAVFVAAVYWASKWIAK